MVRLDGWRLLGFAALSPTYAGGATFDAPLLLRVLGLKVGFGGWELLGFAALIPTYT